MMISAGVIVYMVELKSEFVENVANCHWFSRCGMRDEFSFEVDYLDEAECVEQYIASSKWENVCLEKRGDFTSYLSLNYREEYRKSWNVLVREVKEKFFPSVLDKVQCSLREKDLPLSCVDDIKFNLLNLFMFNFYSDYYKDEFWDNMLAIYLAGHLPCGWSGKFPEGKFIVY